MPRHTLIVVFAALVGGGSCAWPADTGLPPSPNGARTFTLEELTALAESVSPALRQSAAEVESARGRMFQAGLYPNPVVNGGAMQLGGRDSQYYGQLSQEIVTRHKLQLDQAAACRELFQAEYKFVRTRFQLLTAVREGYYAGLAGQKRVEILKQLLELERRSENAARRLQAAGEGTRSDTLLFQIEVEKAEVALLNAETVLAATRRQLAASLGDRDLAIGEIRGDLRIALDAFEQQVLVEGYVPYNADVMAAEQEIDRSRYLLQRARVEPFPNVTVSAGYMRQLVGTNNITLLELSMPVPVWNQNQGNIYAAHANVSRAAENFYNLQNSLSRQMSEGRGRYLAADQLVDRYENRIIPLAKESVQVIQQAFEQGQFDFLRLLQAQRALVEAQLGYINALETRWMAAASLAGLAQLDPFP